MLKDGSDAKSIAIIHCVGSRDKDYHEYCSRVCCMYSLKFCHLIKENTRAKVYQFYMDMSALVRAMRSSIIESLRRRDQSSSGARWPKLLTS